MGGAPHCDCAGRGDRCSRQKDSLTWDILGTARAGAQSRRPRSAAPTLPVSGSLRGPNDASLSPATPLRDHPVVSLASQRLAFPRRGNYAYVHVITSTPYVIYKSSNALSPVTPRARGTYRRHFPPENGQPRSAFHGTDAAMAASHDGAPAGRGRPERRRGCWQRSFLRGDAR